MNAPTETAPDGRPRTPGRRVRAVARRVIGVLGAVIAVAVVIAIVIGIFALVERATNRVAEGGSVSGRINAQSADEVTLALQRIDAATDIQADAWGYDKLTESNSPNDGKPYIATFHVTAKGHLSTSDWNGFIWALRDEAGDVDTNIQPTGDAPGVPGCTITEVALTDALNRSGEGTFCALIRSKHFPTEVSYVQLYKEVSTRRQQATTPATARWDIKHVGTWTGRAR